MWEEETKAPRACWTLDQKKRKPGIELGTGVGVPNPLGPFLPMAFPLCAGGRSIFRKIKKWTYYPQRGFPGSPEGSWTSFQLVGHWQLDRRGIPVAHKKYGGKASPTKLVAEDSFVQKFARGIGGKLTGRNR